MHHWHNLLCAMSEGALVLAATKRLARRFRQSYDQWMVETGRSAWASPAVRSADGWLRQAAETLGEGWRLLDPLASRRLWERIIEEDASASGSGLVQTVAAAREADEAHALISEYGCDPEDHPLTEDHAAFLRWRRLFVQACHKEGWFDRAALAQRIAAAIRMGELPAPKKIVFTGFDELPPRFQCIIKAFTEIGSKVEELFPTPAEESLLVRISCVNAGEEVRAAARWARGILEKGEGEIGVVVPDLPGYRKLIERIFREEIDPLSQIRPDNEEVRFNLSLGEPLADQGAVVAALEILLTDNRLSLPRTGYLLRSPYLRGGVSEALSRARLDRRLRSEGASELSIMRLQSMAKRDGVVVLEAICGALADFSGNRGKFLPGAWASRFSALLDDVGWPGERPLDSREFQVVKAWREKALSRLAAFDLVSGPVTKGEAASLLRRTAEEILFQPESPESSIQVMGLLETAGLNFRHLWIMGLHDGALPAPGRPNPFLPVPLQVASGMPHADPAREAEFGRRLADRLFSAAPVVVVSSPQKEGDALLPPSPFIRNLVEGEVPLAPRSAPAHLWREQKIVPEIFEDPFGPPLGENDRTLGGLAILRDQALCPFRAFVRHRLNAKALEVPDIGLDARARGTLLHKVLEFFWSETRDQTNLLALRREEMIRRVENSVERAVILLFPDSRGGSLAEIFNLEKKRLTTLVMEWLLEVEFNRRPFAVLESEGERRAEFGGVEFSTRIDRVDKLEDGSLLVLDYKTGNVDAADIIADRLVEPQLPIYGLNREGGEIAGVAFAALRRGRCAFCGVTRDAVVLPNVPSLSEWKKAREKEIGSWEELLGNWRDQLHALGRAFAAGHAEVDPVSFEKACRICDLAAFCRITETAPLVDEGEEE